MKKNIVILGGCVLLLSCATAAYCADGPYVSANIGWAMANDSDISYTDPSDNGAIEYDTGLALSGAVGYATGNLRIEGEVGYQKNDYDKWSDPGGSWDASGDMRVLSFLANGYYDFVNASAVTPYLSAGLGFADVEFNNPGHSADDTVFAYQVGAGVGFAVSKQVTIDLKYRFFATADPKFDDAEAECASHNIMLGLRYSF
ncbi:MAG: hypothetical protein A2521_05235 [Deltaproteobacteria bacterium RIFOXYD12_FULL_57_12]|nr:MAG: hypothetical protein A2521_05235 [Deltaproteobacteria bacterium RIFOXYD12_FULL_57_12]